jgi:hypothetical protein
MTNVGEQKEITMDAVRNLLAETGYETSLGGEESCVFVKDPESGLTFTCVLENNILYNAVACMELDESKISAELMRRLLDSDNGISTSGFQLYKSKSGKVIITLNNFCKLQDLGKEDRDDILSCLNFINVDVLAARDLFSDFL